MKEDENIVYDEKEGKNRTVIKREGENTLRVIHYRKIRGEWIRDDQIPSVAPEGLTLTEALLLACDYYDWFPQSVRILFVLNDKMKAKEIKKRSGIPHNEFVKALRLALNSNAIHKVRDMKEIYYEITDEGKESRDFWIKIARANAWLINYETEEEREEDLSEYEDL